MEELEVYDHLANKKTLVIYMAAEGEKWVHLAGGMLTNGRLTRILQDSYDYRPVHQRKVEIGTRLTCSAEVPGTTLRTSRTFPTDWVVVNVETYEPTIDVPGFREVAIAYCERQPLSLEEFKAAIYDNNVKVSVDSFGGDEEAYQRFIASNEAKGYVQVDS